MFKSWRIAGREPGYVGAALVALACMGMSQAIADPITELGQATDVVGARYEDPGMIWQILLIGFVVFTFLTAAIIWVATSLRRMRMSHSRRMTFINGSLNRMEQGILMMSATERVIFCNDKYLEMYGLSRSDLFEGISRSDLLELRASHDMLGCSPEDYRQNLDAQSEIVSELSDGRSILTRNSLLANGGIVSLHEDCTEQRKLAKQLAATKSFIESVVDNIPVCISAKSIGDRRYTLVNRAFERLTGLPREQIVGRRVEEIFSNLTAVAVEAADRETMQSGDGSFASEMTIELGGDKRILSSNRVIVRDEEGNPQFLIAMFEDITERHQLQQEVDNTRKFLQRVVDHIPIALLVRRVNDSTFQLFNRAAEKMTNRTREQTIGRTVADVFGAEIALNTRRRDLRAVNDQGIIAEEQPLKTEDGLRLFSTRRVAVFDDSGDPQYIIQTHEDVTQRRQTETRLAHMAYHDALTELPNRASFLQSLTQMIETCGATDDEFAVLSIDLDRLKEINDVFGHDVGDEVLVQAGQRMQHVASGGMIARLAGDEFGVLIDGNQPEAALKVAASLQAAIGREFVIAGKTVRLGMTIGIAVFPYNGTTAAALLANADVALSRAKQKSRGSIRCFEAEMDQRVRDRRALHQDLVDAIRNGELAMHYQPLARAKAQSPGLHEFVGFEALVRWKHPLRGFVPPSDFIPLAEESGLIVEMGEWILREACREAASWPSPLAIAVNLSPVQFLHGDLVGLVHTLLLETGLAPNRLELEITEGVLIEDFDRGLLLLRQLKALGVRIAMDDFGSGYSSLTYLQAFPFDKIKIDRGFIQNLDRTPQSAAIIRAMIGLCHALGVTMVAEGVETEAQLAFLSAEGCELVQGYLLGRPAPIAQYPHLVGRPAATGAQALKAG